MVNPVLTTAAQFGDRALFDTMTAELQKTTDRQQRGRILGAMGSFRDPAIARAGMDMVIHSDIDIRESLALLFGPLGQPETEKLPFEFVKANYDELLKRLPTGGGFEAGAMLPFVGGNACDRSVAPGVRRASSKSAPRSSPAASTTTTRCWKHPPLRSPEVRPRPPISPPSSRSSSSVRSWRHCAKPFCHTAAAKLKLSHDSNAIRLCRAGTHPTGKAQERRAEDPRRPGHRARRRPAGQEGDRRRPAR